VPQGAASLSVAVLESDGRKKESDSRIGESRTRKDER
jgi:hypothetical protein